MPLFQRELFVFPGGEKTTLSNNGKWKCTYRSAISFFPRGKKLLSARKANSRERVAFGLIQ